LEKMNKIKPYENRTINKAVYDGHTVATMILWALQHFTKSLYFTVTAQQFITVTYTMILQRANIQLQC